MNVETGRSYTAEDEPMLALMRGENLESASSGQGWTPAEKDVVRDRWEEEERYGVPMNRHERRAAASRARRTQR